MCQFFDQARINELYEKEAIYLTSEFHRQPVEEGAKPDPHAPQVCASLSPLPTQLPKRERTLL